MVNCKYMKTIIQKDKDKMTKIKKEVLLPNLYEMWLSRENKLIKKFGENRIKYLRSSLDLIQNSDIVEIFFSKDTPLTVTNEELIFLEEEDKKTERYFVDYNLKEYYESIKNWSSRWVRQPFQTDFQVKRLLKELHDTNQMKNVSNLSITSETVLDNEINLLQENGTTKQVPLRLYRFKRMYDWVPLSWSDKIKITHKVSFKIVESLTPEQLETSEVRLS